MTQRERELREQIETHEAILRHLRGTMQVLQNVKARGLQNVRQLKEFSDAEKISAFDRLYRHMAENVRHYIEQGHAPKDEEYHVYELAMGLTLGTEGWKIINEILTG